MWGNPPFLGYCRTYGILFRLSLAPAAGKSRTCGEQVAQDGSAAPAAGNSRKTASPSRPCACFTPISPRCCHRATREQGKTVPRRRGDVLTLRQRAGRCVQAQPVCVYYSIKRKTRKQRARRIHRPVKFVGTKTRTPLKIAANLPCRPMAGPRAAQKDPSAT